MPSKNLVAQAQTLKPPEAKGQAAAAGAGANLQVNMQLHSSFIFKRAL